MWSWMKWIGAVALAIAMTGASACTDDEGKAGADTTGGADTTAETGGGDATAPGDALADTGAGGVPQATTAALPDGHQVVDLVPVFLAYADAGKELDAAGRTQLWDHWLEQPHQAFFDAAIYRGLQGAERDTWKAQVIDQFWSELVPAGLDDLATIDADALTHVVQGRADFAAAFPGFAPDCDYMLTIAFSFAGKVVDMGTGRVFALGLESFALGGPELDITVAHEQLHLLHFATFSPQGGLYRGVWSEGMAVYASGLVVPGYKFSQYLGFPADRMNAIYDLFDNLKEDIAANLSSSDQALKRAYLGVEPNDTWIPPGSGYYIGYYLVKKLLDTHDYATLLAWDADTVYQAMEATLPTLDRDDW